MTRTDTGLCYAIDTTGERFGALVTIAHLAVNSFTGEDSSRLNIDHAIAVIERDWRFELEDYECEYLTHYTATFKDGSRLILAAWGSDQDHDARTFDAYAYAA